MKNNFIKIVLLVIPIHFALLSFLFAQLPAFPGAMGFGSDTPGGRGGRVIEVTNLNDAGPGSFRAALEASGPRIVVFRVGGTLQTNKLFFIRNPYITIAGQTAPGDGFMIRGTAIKIFTHDVIIRGLGIRVGDDPNGPDPLDRDGMNLLNKNDPVYNVILDHNSISWALDKGIGLWRGTHDVTIQWSIISEGLRYSIHPKTINNGRDHSTGLLVGDGSNHVSIHHNLFAHNLRRNPAIKPVSNAEVINNLVYNWKIGTTIGGSANVIGNIYKAGVNTGGAKGIILPSWMNARGPLYVKDNIGPGRPTNTGDNWLAVNGPSSGRSLSLVMPLSNVVIDPVDIVYDKVLANVGARPWNPDVVDQRIINDVNQGTGQFIDSQNEVGGWPNLRSGTPPMDSDHDGMPDSWELAHNLNPQDPSDGNKDRDGDGYTNIEEYINGLFVVSKSNLQAPKNLKLDK